MPGFNGSIEHVGYIILIVAALARSCQTDIQIRVCCQLKSRSQNVSQLKKSLLEIIRIQYCDGLSDNVSFSIKARYLG